jgi:hypothetical protein
VPGVEGRDFELTAALNDRNLWPIQLPRAVPVCHFTQQGIFFARPRTITSFGLENSLVAAALPNGIQSATEPAGKFSIPHSSEPLVFLRCPTA